MWHGAGCACGVCVVWCGMCVAGGVGGVCLWCGVWCGVCGVVCMHVVGGVGGVCVVWYVV